MPQNDAQKGVYACADNKAQLLVSLPKDYQGYQRNIKCIDHPLTVATVVIIRSYKMTITVATKYKAWTQFINGCSYVPL